MSNSRLLSNIKGLWLPPQHQIQPVKGQDLVKTNVLTDAFLWIENGKIEGFGPMQNLSELVPERIQNQANGIDCTGRYVLPAWVDAHSHLVFAAWRENEMEMRLRGSSYMEIAAQGGGILNSANRLELVSENQLFDEAWERLHSLIAMGTGALEIKSGYGLSLDSELKMLRVIQRIKEKSPIPIKATFLGAHAIPKKYTNRRDYIQLVIREMIPAVAAEKLADFCDVFCDTGFFTADETEEILLAGLAHGLQPKVHANELARSGGVQAGVKVGAISVDHLECVEQEELDLLLHSKTIPVLLPGTAFFLGIHPPPARKMINAGLPVALSTDYNPGTCPSGNMEWVISMASAMLKMQPAEAIHAATINSAHAMDLAGSAGRIQVGNSANLLITKPIPSLAFIQYHFGESSIAQVLTNGIVI
jgi:imidazolonepropionase